MRDEKVKIIKTEIKSIVQKDLEQQCLNITRLSIMDLSNHNGDKIIHRAQKQKDKVVKRNFGNRREQR